MMTCIAGVLAAASLAATPLELFDLPQTIPGVFRPVGVAAGDFNRDGLLDLAAVSGNDELQLFEAEAAGGPGVRFEQRASRFAGTVLFQVRAHDFDKDGDDDLLAADPGTRAYFFRSQGNMSFDDPVPFTESLGARWITLGDFDGDGNMDFASANDNAVSVTVYLGNGDATFRFLEKYTVEAHSVEALDFNGDGVLDLMCGVGFPDAMIPLRGKGGGRFEALASVPNLNGCVDAVVAGDLNGDGLDDLAPTCIHSDTVFVGLSKGDGTFEKTLTLQAGKGSEISSIVDLDGDGKRDIVLAGRDSRLLHVWRGVGGGNFAPPAVFGPTGEQPAFLLPRDFNGDGKLDLITADSFSSTVTVFLGREGPLFLRGASGISGFEAGRAAAVIDFGGDGTLDLFVAETNRAKTHVFRRPILATIGEPDPTLAGLSGVSGIVGADLDSDGIGDLAATTLTTGAVHVLFLDALGVTKASERRDVGLQPQEVQLASLDPSDGGHTDLVVPCTGSDHIAIVDGLPGGRFAELPRSLTTIGRPRRVEVVDLDRDGRVDLSVLSQRAVAVHRGLGAATFGAPVAIVDDEALEFAGLAVADLNYDLLPDLAAIEGTQSLLWVWLNDGGRGWRPPVRRPAGRDPSAIVAADFDRDGALDFAIGSAQHPEIVLFLQRATFENAEFLEFPLAFGVQDFETADFDGDGAPELIALGRESGQILRGLAVAPPPARFRRGDVNFDAELDLTDAITILGYLFLDGVTINCQDAADIDDDGELSLTDAIYELNYLFLGGPGPLAPLGCGEDGTGDALERCRDRC